MTGRTGKALRWAGLATIGLLVVLLLARWLVDFERARERQSLDTSLRARGGLKGTHLEVAWPARQAQPPVTFRIPREFVDDATTFSDAKGIVSFSILLELRGRAAAQDVSPDKAGASVEPPQVRPRRYLVQVHRDFHSGYAVRQFARAGGYKVGDPPDGVVGGLDRFSKVRCYTSEQLRGDINQHLVKFLAEKPLDDKSPPNCRLDRDHATYLSPQSVLADDEGVHVECMSTGCKAYFSSAGRGLSIGLSHADVPRWSDYVEPARDLIRSFVVAGEQPLPRENQGQQK